MENNNNPFNNTFDAINKAVDDIDKMTREEDENTNSAEENSNPSFVLYHAIAETVVSVLSREEVANTFKMLASSLGEAESKSLVELLAIIITQANYQSLIFYDNLLKGELIKQFDHYTASINNIAADVNAHNSVLKVFKKTLGEIQDSLKIEKFQSENHINVDPNNH